MNIPSSHLPTRPPGNRHTPADKRARYTETTVRGRLTQREPGLSGLCARPGRPKVITLLPSRAQWKHFSPLSSLLFRLLSCRLVSHVYPHGHLLRVQLRGPVRHPRPTLSLFGPPISFRFLFFEAACILGGSSSSSTSGKDTSSNPSNYKTETRKNRSIVIALTQTKLHFPHEFLIIELSSRM